MDDDDDTANDAVEIEELRTEYFGDKHNEGGFIVDVSDEEDFLTIIYKATAEDIQQFVDEEAKEDLPLIVKPIHFPLFVTVIRKVNIVWELIITVLLYATIVSSTYMAFFEFFNDQVAAYIMYVDFIYSLDIIIRIVIEIWRHHTRCPYKVFLVNYSFFLGIMDVLALLPFDYLFMWLMDMDKLSVVKNIKFFIINKVLRFSRMSRFFDKLGEGLGTGQRAISITKYVLVFFLILHFFCCAMFASCNVPYIEWLLHRAQHIDDSKVAAASCYMRHRNNKAYPPVEFAQNHPVSIVIYIFTLEFVTAIISTVGYGEIYPLNNLERLLAVIIMFVGAVWISGDLSSTLQTFIIERDAALYSLFFRMEGIRNYMSEPEHLASEFLDKKIRAYYEYLWNYREGVHDIDEDVKSMPGCLQEDIQFDICEEMFYKSPLFRGLEETFLHSLAKKAEVRLLNPDIQVIEQGAVCQEMYYILQGELGVLHDVDYDVTTLIYRAGCSLGEVNLFEALPYENTVYTRTVCQLLVISRESVLTQLQNNPHIYTIMRQRIAHRRQDLRNSHKLVSFHPILNAVYRKDEEEMKGTVSGIDPSEYPVVIRSSIGFNRIITGDILLDTKETYIIEMPCTKKELAKTPAKAYRELIIPTILISDSPVLKCWNVLSLVLWILMVIATPMCLMFDPYSNPRIQICSLMTRKFYVLTFVNIVDLLVEILAAVPSTGIRFKFLDGYHMKRGLIEFYFDLSTTIPVELVFNSWAVPVYKNFIKIWKIFRLCTYLDQTHPKQLFFTRLFKILIMFFFGLYTLSWYLLWMVCPYGDKKKCKPINWFDSGGTDPRTSKLRDGEVHEESPFLAACKFAAATMTTVGFGDITPQTTEEMLSLAIVMAAVVFMTAYILAELTSALSALFRPLVTFNQKLQTITTFMQHQGFHDKMTRRVVEHYRLSYQLLKNCILPPGKVHLLFDAPKDIYEDALLTESEKFFEGVPILCKLDPKAAIKLAHSMNQYMLPPDITFVRRGEVRRQLYIIITGWVALYNKRSKEPAAILRTTGHFGLKDLLFGQPYQETVRTLSHVVVYAIDYPVFEAVFREDEEFLRFVSKQKKSRQDETRKLLAKTYDTEDRANEGPADVPSWIRYSSHPDTPILKGCTDFEDWERPFVCCKGTLAGILRNVLMPKSLHPYGSFVKLWSVIVGISVLQNISMLMSESWMGERKPSFRHLQFCVDLVFCADVFLSLHRGYAQNGKLYYHPLKITLNYIFHGSFFIDLLLLLPAELVIVVLGGTDLLGYGPGYSWYTKLRWIRFGRIYKFTEAFTLVHSTFNYRSVLFFFFFLGMSLLMSVAAGKIACYIACPTFSHQWQEGDEFKLPACKILSWINIKFQDSVDLIEASKSKSTGLEKTVHPSTFGTRWTLMVYYVGQVLMVVGFGDLVTLSEKETLFLFVISIFGFLTMQIMISDMSAAQVDSDESRATSREKLNRIGIVLSREKTPSKFLRLVKGHFLLQWSHTKGYQPRDLFSDLHPVLESDVFMEYAGDVFERVPVFRGFSKSVLHSMCKFMKKEYFVRGEMIMRYGNLEYEIFVISGGEVYITDSQDRWISTLGIGESIGEMSLVYTSKRLYSAYAATTLEVFTLTSEDFSEILDRFPTVREKVVDVLRKYKRDMFLIKAWKMKAADPDKYEQEQKERTEELATFIRPHDLNTKIEGFVKLRPKEEFHPEPKWFQNIIGHGSEDLVDHYFLYFASRKHKGWSLVIHPACKFVAHFGFLIQRIRYFLPIVAVYNVFFYTGDPKDPETTYHAQFLMIILDAIYWVYVILQFFTAWELEGQKVYCKTLRKVALHYLLVPNLFLFNLLAIFPYQLVTGNGGTKLLLFRCLLLIEYFGKLSEKKENLEVTMFVYKLSVSLPVFGLMAHAFACLFYWVSCPKTTVSSCRADSWIMRYKQDLGDIGFDLNSATKPSTWYLMSVYWVITTMTTTGFGDINPVNISEITIATFCVFFGAFSLSIILGNITTGLASLHQTEREFFYHWKVVINHLRGIGLSNREQNTLAAYVTRQWYLFRGSNYNESVEILPTCMRYDAYLALFHRCVTHCPFFGKDYSLDFARNVCSRMTHLMFMPGMKISNELEPSPGLHIVLRGAVVSYQLNPKTGENEYKKRYDKYAAFGKLSVLFPDTLSNKSYRAEEKSEVVVLSHDDIRRLLRSFPQWRVYLRGLIKVKYREFEKNTGLKSIVKRRKKGKGNKRILVSDFQDAEEILTLT